MRTIEINMTTWEGVEMTDENCQKRFGCVELVYSLGDKVI